MPPAKPELNHVSTPANRNGPYHPDPKLAQYQGKKVTIQMNGGRTVEGVVRGFDVNLSTLLRSALALS